MHIFTVDYIASRYNIAFMFKTGRRDHPFNPRDILTARPGPLLALDG